MSVPVLRFSDAEPRLDVDTLPVAFWGRTSTYELQDPTLSVPRQLGEVEEKMPAEFAIRAHFWDIESGGMPLEERGRGRAHELFNVPVPRDGGLQDLLREAASPDRRFAAVICSDIERAARESYYGLKLEKDLELLGVPLLAADEPIAFDRRDPGTILFRRLKLSVAEWYRADIKRKTWNGLRTHVAQGWNCGPPPYGYVVEPVPHPVPAKRDEGKTKSRLRPDPARRHVVPLIYQWRVEQRLGYGAIRDRLNADPVVYPTPEHPDPSRRSGVWTASIVQDILANPKYTGFMVWNRHDGKARPRDRSEWIWSAEPAHEALISRELFEQAAGIGQVIEGSRAGNQPNRHPMTRRTYLFRSYVHCAICGRRMRGHQIRGNTYYRCSTSHADPRTAQRFPDHPKAVEVREDLLQAAVQDFFAEHVFGKDRLALLAQHFRDATNQAHAEHVQRVASLETRIAAAEQAKGRLIREIEAMPDDDDLAQAMRADIRERYYRQESERRALVKELDELKAQEPAPPEDPSLLKELPLVPVTLDGVPEDRQRDLFAAFALDIRYDKLCHEAEISITLTDRLARAMRPAPDSADGASEGAVLPLPLVPLALATTPPRGREKRGDLLTSPRHP